MKQQWQQFITLVFVTVLVITVSPWANSQTVPTDLAPFSSPGKGNSGPIAPVVFEGQTLFVIQESLGIASPEQRADRVVDQLTRFAQTQAQPLDALKINERENLTQIEASDGEPIIRISEADARAANLSRQELAQDYLRQIEIVVADYRGARSQDKLVQGGIFSVLATLGLIILLVCLGKSFASLINTLEQRQLPNIEIRGVEVVQAQETAEFLVAFIKSLQFFLTLSLTIIYLVLICSFFPWTRSIAVILWNYAAEAPDAIGESVIGYIPNLVTILIIVLASRYTLRLLKPIFSKLGDGSLQLQGFYQEWAEPTYRLIVIFIFALTMVLVFPYLPGSGSPAFQGISILLGILLSLGSTVAVTNAVAGIILIYTRSFQLGDRICIGDVFGDVEEKLLLVTRIRTFENIIITVPNSSLLSNSITNYSASIRDSQVPVMLTATITLGYDVPWDKIYRVLAQAALFTADILQDPPPFVLQTNLGDFSVTYELKAYTNQPSLMEVIHSELHQNIQDQCNSNDIEILSPIYSAIRDGNTSTMPESYLPPDYKVPGFQLHPLGNLFQVDLKLGGDKGNSNTPK
jgi:small-conductance mechanosensitive channel